MKLRFFGAAHAVTGSCHCLEVNGRKILIDCGLQQGRDEHDDNALDFAPGQIDYCLVTHAHIDHSGRIPLLVKQGFQGNIYCTRLTGQLLSIMLRDSAHIQESDAQWQNQKGKRAGRDAVEPLYTVADAEAALQQLYPVEYGQVLDLCEGVRVRFTDAGHLLGSSEVELWLTEGDVERKIVFSGDLGNIDQPIIRDPSFVEDADYVVMESTYGDRNHEPPESYTESLAQLIDEVFAKGGNIVIPSFAVGRTQELLYFLREIKDRGLVKSAPNFTVCVDSPLAAEATRVYSGDLHGYLDEEAIAALAYGTETVPKVDKIVGPGNAFVAEAKRQVFGLVNIDMIAGPSEILVVADGADRAAAQPELRHVVGEVRGSAADLPPFGQYVPECFADPDDPLCLSVCFGIHCRLRLLRS